MARSPDYLRLATSATRTLAEAAFDGIRDAVVVVDTRVKHLPVVLANQAAQDCLTSPNSESLEESSLYGLLGAASASLIESAMASLSETEPATTHPLTWRPTRGEVAFPTELKLLESPQNQRLVMLTFNPKPSGSGDRPVVRRPLDPGPKSPGHLCQSRRRTLVRAKRQPHRPLRPYPHAHERASPRGF